MIFYNAKTNGFYDSNISEPLKNSIIIDDKYHSELLQKQYAGLVIQPDESGYPIAVKRVLTTKEVIAINESKKQKLINEANGKIAVLQDTIDLDMQEANEEEQLKQWKKYRILLMRVDINQSDINWPEKPNVT
ncbi:tail fiber assembly protein [Gilliamella bombi]|uniref:tail fiber assembly protein n=1 Tax=Gilliamella bombi TaxID=1908521 RepID=UPI000A1653AE|nr:tail fiber assembly protein [Gilliamella bombi]